MGVAPVGRPAAGHAVSTSVNSDTSQTVDILGVEVRIASTVDVEAQTRRYLSDPWDGICRHIATVNPEYVMAARSDPDFAAALRKTDLNTIDGVGVLLAARLLGGHLAGPAARTSGVHLVEWLAHTSGHLAAPLFLLGAGPGVAATAAKALRGTDPTIHIAGMWEGGTPSPEDDYETLERISASGAKALVVAYGAMGQMAFIDRNLERLADRGIRVAVGVGGALDMISGSTPRAPRIVQRVGLEWLYRLAIEPWRWRRQLVLPRFAFLVLRQRILTSVRGTSFHLV